MYYVFLRPWWGNPDAPPYFDSTLTENILGKDPYNKPIRSNDWFNYSYMRAGKLVTMSEEYTLPNHIYWICSGIKKLDTDYFNHTIGEIVSESFLTIIQANNLLPIDAYQYCEVTPISKKLLAISNKKYYLIRIIKYFDEYIDKENCNKVLRYRSQYTEKDYKKNPHLKTYYYQSLALKSEIHLSKIFALFGVSFGGYGFICNQEARDLIANQGLKGFKLVTPDEYIEEMQFRDKNTYPSLELMKERDKIWRFN